MPEQLDGVPLAEAEASAERRAVVAPHIGEFSVPYVAQSAGIGAENHASRSAREGISSSRLALVRKMIRDRKS